MKSVRRLLVAAVVIGLGGCGSSSDGGGSLQTKCMSLCERAQAKNCASDTGSFFDHATCLAGCTAEAQMKADTNVCFAEGTAYYDCTSGLADVCPVFEYAPNTTGGLAQTMACPNESQAYALCIRTFCLTYPTKVYCQ